MVSLSRLAGQLNLKLDGDGDPDLTGITEDSREVKPGWLFVAVSGANLDGRNYVHEAILNGAAAIMFGGDADMKLPVPGLRLQGEDIRPVMASAAAIIYGRPADKLIMVGITGTNGKTTSAYLAEAILEKAGLKPGVMGTINSRWAGCMRPAQNTTPEGPIVNACLSEMLKAGSRAAVMEVSSHGLALGRVSGLAFEAALFTNLSRDHMDFHKDVEDYYQAKKLLFSKYLKPGPAKAIINIDDPAGQRLAQELGDRALTFGFNDQAQVRGSNLKLSRQGLNLTVEYGDLQWRQASPLIAEINAYNILGVAALALAMHISPEVINDALSGSNGAPGRLERAGSNPDYLVLVDYAHSPDALAKALKACRDIEPKRLLVVFGCGGDRDKGKRPMMGRIAGEAADLTIITSDNPRTEEPLEILSDVEAGLDELNLKRFEAGNLSSADWQKGVYTVMVDRREAIFEAVRLMEPGDVLLIAGKGHEDYQIIGREKRHLDDRAEALKALQRFGRG